MKSEIVPTGEDYTALLADIKTHIQAAQGRTALAVSRELILLYHEIGRRILSAQEQHGWGAKIVERLSEDLHRAFPSVSGFSRSNLLYMRAFALAYADNAIVPTVVGRLAFALGPLGAIVGQSERCRNTSVVLASRR